MPDLILRPSGLPERANRPWSLQLRHHGMAETSYDTLCRVADETAFAIVEAGAPYWLFGEPDRKARFQAQALERARALREEADRLERETLGLPRPERQVIFDHAGQIGLVLSTESMDDPLVVSLAREIVRLEADLAAARTQEPRDG